ncbi:Protein of unknown function [Pyronema omphalodes CBS 100304]|uniref:Uncharacterized protein n=1 Tax=Pyronema omphalodes (strain CBS 100304) TaxID=1076935 RepID=U4LVK0_PYROM|nr:Protein of unknown function [Pyronema omphalodes CBS 100304]
MRARSAPACFDLSGNLRLPRAKSAVTLHKMGDELLVLILRKAVDQSLSIG